MPVDLPKYNHYILDFLLFQVCFRELNLNFQKWSFSYTTLVQIVTVDNYTFPPILGK